MTRASNDYASPKEIDQSAAHARLQHNLAALMLNESGLVCAWDSACKMLFGHQESEIVSRHVSVLLPQLANVELLKGGEPNPELRYRCRIGVRFQALARNGEKFHCDLFLNKLRNFGVPPLRMIVCRA